MTQIDDAYSPCDKPSSTITHASLILPSDDQGTFSSVQDNLFTEDPKRSWVEFIAADEYMPESTEEDMMSSEITLKTQANQTGPRRIEKIKSTEGLWEITKFRAKNPIYAFIIRQKNSNSHLLLTKELFNILVLSNDVFEDFKDFVMSFGWKKRELDIGPPPCRFRRDDAGESETFSIDQFPDFECAYGLRYAELNGYGGGKEPWSVRQTAFYHKYREGRHTWILISPSESFQYKTEAYIQKFSAWEEGSQSKNPFELHSILIASATNTWRLYIQSLFERAIEYSSRVVAANVGKGKLSALVDFEINFEDRQLLKVMEEKVLDLFIIFDALSDTISTISEEYEWVKADRGGRKPDRIFSRLKDSLREVKLYQKKAKTLYKMVQGTASLLSDLLDYENAKIAEENGKALAILAHESREENTVMRALTEKATQDAAAVKVITLITIMFLPTTVVTGLFSTQFVKQTDDGKRLEFTDNWWLVVAISLPLTILIIVIWYCWTNLPWRRWWAEWWQRRRRTTTTSSPSEHTLASFRSSTSMRHGSELESGLRSRAMVL